MSDLDQRPPRFPRKLGLILSGVVLIQNGPNILPSGHEVMCVTNVMGLDEGRPARSVWPIGGIA